VEAAEKKKLITRGHEERRDSLQFREHRKLRHTSLPAVGALRRLFTRCRDGHTQGVLKRLEAVCFGRDMGA
jgi:hypothetical protein